MANRTVASQRTPAGTRSTASRRLTPRSMGASCLSFLGNSYINIPDQNYLDFGTGDFSIALWFKPTVNGDTRLVYKFNGDTTRGFMMTWGNTSRKVSFQLFTTGGSTQAAVVSSGSYQNGQWIHAVAMRENSVNKLYVNGASAGSTTGAIADVSGSAAMRIGATLTPDRFFTGFMDDLRIYSRALTESEIAELYYAGTNPDSQSLAGWYKMDEGSGTTATDSSPNANNGSITNGAYSTDVPFGVRIAV